MVLVHRGVKTVDEGITRLNFLHGTESFLTN